MNSPVTSEILRHKQIPIKNASIHVVECGPATGPAVLFLHGWPQDWSAFEKVLFQAGQTMRAVAIDLPGIGASACDSAPGSKKNIAVYIDEIVNTMNLSDLTLVGHDCGGQIAYAYMQNYPTHLKKGVILDVVIPGLDPWNEVLRNPYLWHFAFHNVPNLPEEVVQDHQAHYFDFFFNATSATPDAITAAARKRYVEAYSDPASLHTGFEWYRAFSQDAKDNTVSQVESNQVPLLYLRGAVGFAKIETYLTGFEKAGLRFVEGDLIANSGHFIPDEQPEALWTRIKAFIEK